jgi:cobalt-zinc-cadmium efflux system membrane fusion protein
MHRLKSYLSNALVVLMLGGIALWGHHTHWKLPHSVAHADAEKTPEPENLTDPSERSQKTEEVVFNSPEEVREAGIACTPAAARPIDHQIISNAVVGYDRTRIAQLSVRVPGNVYTCERHIGQAVHRGDILALIDAEEVGRAKAEFLKEAVACTYQTKRVRRLQEAEQRGAISDRTVREAEADLQKASVACFNAQQKLLNLGLPVAFDPDNHARLTELSRQIQFLGLPRPLIERMKPRPQTANLIPIVAPLDGVITAVDLVVGERVTPDRPQFVIADVRHMWVHLSVRREDALDLRLGQPVHFQPDGVAAGVDGQINWIGTEIDEKTRTVQARADVTNTLLSAATDSLDAPRLLQTNMFGTAHIQIERHAHAVLVPAAAVQRLDRRTLVFVADSDGCRFVPHTVRLGIAADGFVEILEGVQPGERVVVAGSYVLKSELMKDALVAD